jgi:transcription elongation factor GreA
MEIYITENDFRELEKKHHQLESQAAAILKKMAEAASLGGSAMHGIPEYRSLEYQLKIIDSSISKLIETMEKYTVVTNLKTNDRVNHYSLVKTDEDKNFYIQDLNLPPASLPENVSVVSPFSPVGQALIGKKAGATVNIKTPSGEKKVNITSIDFLIKNT